MERPAMAICRECLFALRQVKPTSQWRLATPLIRQSTGRNFTTTTQSQSPRRHASNKDHRNGRAQHPRLLSSTAPRDRTAKPGNLTSIHARIFELSNTAVEPENGQPPSEQRILYVLEQLDALAKTLTDARSVANAKAERENGNAADTTATATFALLGSVNARQYPAFLSKASLLNLISEKAEQILRHPLIFITPAILKTYVELQTQLHQPSSFPDIFALYAAKPAPRISSSSRSSSGQTNITFTTPNRDKINAAVSSPTATTALTAAITAHNLPLCLDIINTTVSVPAYRKSKILRQAFLPFSGLLLAPAGAYALSTQYSLWQSSMEASYATGVAFAGIMTYVATVSGLGYVVITTANDQMERVTWARGVPLWERWVREEERAALDRVACAWGFRDVSRRGEEEGEEWEGLREEVGRRGMCLDKVELMEGME